jgi:ABC-type lipopolysaccharide export system ATPase subunit
MKRKIFEAENITAKYKDKTVVSNVSLDVGEKESIGIYSDEVDDLRVLFNVLTGIERPEDGDIYFFDKNAAKFSNDEWSKFRLINIGIADDRLILNDITVKEWILFCMNGVTEKRSEKLTRLDSLLKFFNFDSKKLSTMIKELEDFDKVIINLIGGIASSPKILFFFDIFEFDQKTSKTINSILERIVKEKGIAIVHFADKWDKLKSGRILKLKHSRLTR